MPDEPAAPDQEGVSVDLHSQNGGGPLPAPGLAPVVPPSAQSTDTGADGFPPGINPLTGLPVTDPETLNKPPALVSVANWPVSTRPQAGLSFSPMVYELYIGEGMSRFLAIFYGDYPVEAREGGTGVGGAGLPLDDAGIGPVRSGRLPYEHIRKLYNGFLVMASAYRGVAAHLSSTTNIFGSDESDINSAMIPVSRLASIAASNPNLLAEGSLAGMRFDYRVPPGGKEARRFWFMFNAVDQVLWRYDPAGQTWHRWQDNADGTTFIQATDRLTGEPLTYENVVLLFANHRACTETAFDIDLLYMDRMPALLFRDGRVYNIYWSTRSAEYEKITGKLRPIRFIDEHGDPFPFHPGQTWVHLVPQNTPYWETADTEVLFDLLNKPQAGTGNWAARFHPSLMVEDPQVCQAIR